MPAATEVFVPNEQFGIAKDREGNWYVAILTDDGRARVDFHCRFEDITLYQAEFRDPKNPWASEFRVGPKITDRDLDRT